MNEPKSITGEGSELPALTWTQETMRIINGLTPDIHGKPFDPDWFLLRQRFELIELELKSALSSPRQESALKKAMPELIEKAWRAEERCASGALRYSRTDYACQELGRLVLEFLAPPVTAEGKNE